MRTLLLLLFASPVLLSAQSIEALYNPLQKKAGVQSITAYKIAEGKKQTLEHIAYDTSGKMIAHGKYRHNGYSAAFTYDTILFGSSGAITITIRDEIVQDSVVQRYDSVTGARIYTHYKKGMVTEVEVFSGDSLNRVHTMEQYEDGKLKLRQQTNGRYTYDTSGRVLSRSATDSVFYSGMKFELDGEYYEIEYTDQGEVQTYYELKEDHKRIHSRSYWNEHTSVDSTVYYSEKGRISNISVSYADSLGRQTAYKQMTKKGKVNYRIVWMYGSDSITQKTYNEKAGLTYTQVLLFDAKGLITKESEVGVERNTEVFYEYTYFR